MTEKLAHTYILLQFSHAHIYIHMNILYIVFKTCIELAPPIHRQPKIKLNHNLFFALFFDLAEARIPLGFLMLIDCQIMPNITIVVGPIFVTIVNFESHGLHVPC